MKGCGLVVVRDSVGTVADPIMGAANQRSFGRYLLVYRVAGFLAQQGCCLARGTGNSGCSIWRGPEKRIEAEIHSGKQTPFVHFCGLDCVRHGFTFFLAL